MRASGERAQCDRVEPKAGRERHHHIDRAVDLINEEILRGGLESVHRIGRFVLDEFFGGDDTRLEEGRGGLRVTFRVLAEHPDLSISASTLYSFVRISQQLEDMPPDIAGRLTVTQHRVLLPLESIEDKIALATQAIEWGWDLKTLHRLVRAMKPASPKGRPPLPSWVHEIPRAARALKSAASEEVSLSEFQRLGPERRAELHGLLRACRCHLGELEAAFYDAKLRDPVQRGL